MYEELIITSTVCEVLILRPTAEAVCITGISSSMTQQARAKRRKVQRFKELEENTAVQKRDRQRELKYNTTIQVPTRPRDWRR